MEELLLAQISKKLWLLFKTMKRRCFKSLIIFLVGLLCVMSLQSEINRIEDAKGDIRNAIVEKGVSVPTSAKIDEYASYVSQIPTGGNGMSIDVSNLIIFGDSFTQGWTPDGTVTSWGELLVKMLGDMVSQSDVYGEGGCGFSHSSASTGRTFLQAWNNHRSSISWLSKATTVIVMGGINDSDQEYGDVVSGLKSLIDRIRVDCPYAKIIYMFNPAISVYEPNIIRACYRAYSSGEVSGFLKINSWWWVLLENTLFASDYLHPTLNGQKQIAQNVYNSLFGLNVTHMINYDLDLNAGTSATLYIRDDKVRFYFSSNITAARAISVAYFEEWMFPNSSHGGPNSRYNDVVGLLSSGTTFPQPIIASFGQSSNGRVIYFIHIGSDLSTGSAFYNRTFDALEFFG